MKLGIAIPESVTDQHLLGAAIDARPVKPDAVAVWAQGLVLDIEGVRALRACGIQPLVYAQTARWSAESILSGQHDIDIDTLAMNLSVFAPDTIVRLNQEPNGPGLRADWNLWSPETFISVFRYISTRIHAIAPDVRMAYCIAWRGKDYADDFRRWYPGNYACQVVGFDAYVTSPIQRPSRIWPAAIRTIRETTPSKPIWVMEAGVSRWVPFRGRRLREMRRVQGLAGIVLMDMRIEHYGKIHDWELNERLRRLWR